jgi:hypothetical protein
MQTTTQVAVDPGKVAVDPGKGASGIEAYVLDADALLAFIADDGLPDSHIVGGKVQLVRAGQRVVTRKRVGQSWDWLSSSRWKIVR